MQAAELIEEEIHPISLQITGIEALELMNDWGVEHAPVVHDGNFLGIIEEEEILQYDIEERLALFPLQFKKVQIHQGDHIYDALRMIAEFDLSLIPVQNDKSEIIGALTSNKVVNVFADRFGFQQPGAIIILQKAKNDYVLSEIARIIENEDAVILHLGIESNPNSNMMDIHLKISTSEVSRVVSALNRYDYVVKAAFQSEEGNDLLKDRYDSLLRYLDM